MVCTTHTPTGYAAAGCFQGRASQVFAVLPTHLNFENRFATVRSRLFPPHCHEPCKPLRSVKKKEKAFLQVPERQGRQSKLCNFTMRNSRRDGLL